MAAWLGLAGGEDEVAEFADGAVAAEGARDVDGGRPHGGDGVGDGDGKADERHRRQVADVVTHVARVRRADAVPRQDPLHDGALVRRVLVDLDDAQLARAALDDLRVAACDHGRDHAGLAEQHEALAVADVEALELLAAVGVPDAAVGEHAIHVHRDQAHGGQPRAGGPALHAPRPPRPRPTTNGKGLTLSIARSTPGAPKLYSKRPAPREGVTAARAPAASERSGGARAGTRR